MPIDSKPSDTPPTVTASPKDNWMVSYLKNNPLRVVISVMTILGLLVTSAWAADARYNQMPQINDIHQQMIYDRNQTLEDNIFVLELKKSSGKITDIERALLERYKTRLDHAKMMK